MSDAKNPWSFLGYDLRQVVSPAFWKLAWKELFHEKHRFFNPYLSEPVTLITPTEGELCIRQDQPIKPRKTKATAYLLPTDKYLVRQLTIPAETEAHLADYLGLEVASSSPFPEAETRIGWHVVSRNAHSITLLLVITSSSLITRTLGTGTSYQGANSPEIWASTDAGYVEIQGYGENRRYKRLQRRILWLGIKVTVLFGLVLLLTLLPAGFKYLEKQKLHAQYLALEAQAGRAVELREQLVANNTMIGNVKAMPATHLDPLQELERLTRNLPDDVYLMSMEISPRTIRMTGQAEDAAALQQALNRDPAYERVTSPAAISINRRTGKEQFTLEITLKQGGGA